MGFWAGFGIGAIVAASIVTVFISCLKVGKQSDLETQNHLLKLKITQLEGSKCVNCIKPLIENIKGKTCNCEYRDECPIYRQELACKFDKTECQCYKTKKSNEEIAKKYGLKGGK